MQCLQRNWDGIRYRGDAEDSRALFDSYNVGGFLDAREGEIRERGDSSRSQLRKDGVLLNALVSPRIHGIVRNVQVRLGVEGVFEVYCIRENDVNAFALLDYSEEKPCHVVGITSTAAEMLDDNEIAFLLGHELGHFIYEHNRLLGLLNRDQHNPKITVLPYLGECLFLRWRKKSEISADRLGLVACGSFESAARALIKAGFGLSDRNINTDTDALLRQIEAFRDRPEMIEASYRSHPLLPLRLKSLQLFSQATATVGPNAQAEADTAIDDLFAWFKRYPRKPVAEAVMQIVALAGLRIAGVEGDVDDEEVRTLIYVLHNWFTDTPEVELITDPIENERRWKAAVKLVREKGDDGDRGFIISRLSEIALADGKLLEKEGGVILETAEALGWSARNAYGTIIGAAQAVGFQVDYQMKEITLRVRTQLMETARDNAGNR
jgi:hypothetical protein